MEREFKNNDNNGNQLISANFRYQFWILLVSCLLEGLCINNKDWFKGQGFVVWSCVLNTFSDYALACIGES